MNAARTQMLNTCKRRSPGVIKAYAAKDFQLMIRMEAADDHGMVQCVTCGKKLHYKSADAGHFVGGRTWAALFVETPIRNCHPQCRHCNDHKSGMRHEYEMFMVAVYGAKKVAELKAVIAQDNRGKPTDEEIVEMRLRYRARIRVQEQRLNGV